MMFFGFDGGYFFNEVMVVYIGIMVSEKVELSLDEVVSMKVLEKRFFNGKVF